jgi:predicted  nucleic acid-binding Zn-ribbon protein
MKIFDWIRKKKVIEDEVVVENISFGDIGKWLGSRGNDLREYEKGALVDIEERFKGFYISLGEKLEVLKEVDIESKNEHGRAKVLVRQGLDKYINFVHILLKELRGIEIVDLDKVIREIGDAFVGFERNSAKGYERATYLVGDEMMVVRNEIRGFYNGLVKMFEDDKSSIRDLGRVRNVRFKLDEFGNSERDMGMIKKEIEMKDKEIEKVRGKVKELKSEIEKIKLSLEYIANLKRGEDIKVLRMRLEKEIYLLKGLVDFKKIIGIVHGNEKEFGLIREYRDHFAIEFSRDGGKKLLKLLEDLNMKSSVIREKFDLIREKEVSLEKKVGEVGLDIVTVKMEEVARVEDGIDEMKTDKVKIERRFEEVNLRLKGLRNEVILLVEEISGVRVVS